jgi:putative colanic acid biosysnthesis UDP-glucose lipid carrier transferase
MKELPAKDLSIYSSQNGIRRHNPDGEHSPLKKPYLFFKRIFDILFSCLVILLVFPWLLPILIIAIRINSKGPVFFRQIRIGMGGEPFICVKLRTMYVNNFADTKQAANNDPRITSFGKFLRTTGLDELPQFINIIRGNMSLVGPRPHMLVEHSEFAAIIPGYLLRNRLRPGITGLAQVRGYRGVASNFVSISKRYQFDIYYVRHIDFMLDLRIMLLTLKLMIKALFNGNKLSSADQSALEDQADLAGNSQAAYQQQTSLSKLHL